MAIAYGEIVEKPCYWEEATIGVDMSAEARGRPVFTSMTICTGDCVAEPKAGESSSAKTGVVRASERNEIIAIFDMGLLTLNNIEPACAKLVNKAFSQPNKRVAGCAPRH
jgi:hypothetical protein